MISEGSCDTEDWSNDAENSALITGISNIKIENTPFILYITLLLYCVFDQINAALVIIRDFFQKQNKQKKTC